MLQLSAALFGITVWALIFRASVGLLERGNPKNSFGTALLLGIIFGFFAPYATSAFFIAGVILGLLALLGLFRILIHHYELGLLRAIGVILLAEGGLYLAREAFIALFLASPAAAHALLVALPAVVLVGWRVLRRRDRLEASSDVPRARAVRWRPQAKDTSSEPDPPGRAPAAPRGADPTAGEAAPAASPGVERDREPNILR